MICISCWTQIESFHTYYLNVEDAQRRFSQLYLEQKIKEESDKKEIELLPFDQGEINNYQEAEYPELHTNNKLADSGGNINSEVKILTLLKFQSFREKL